MSDIEWPDPVPVDVTPHGPDNGPERVTPRFGVDQEARRAHLAHESTGGSPGCEWCVFTEDGFQTHNCRSCTRPIVWATTDDGKSIPVDASADPEGNVVLTRTQFGGVRVTVLDQESLFDDGTRRKSHFATCPDADSWRSRRSR